MGGYEIDTGTSTVTFRIRHLFGLAVAHGTFAIRAGTVDVVEPADSSRVDVDIDTASFHTGNEQRDTNIRSARFLDADKYPTMTFTSGRLNGSTLDGSLTVAGVARPVRLTIEQLVVEPSSFTVRAKTRLDRTAFGVSALRGIVGRHLDVTLEIRCARA